MPVIYRGQEIVRIYRGVGSIGPVERARLASERLNQFVRDPSFDPTRVTSDIARPSANWSTTTASWASLPTRMRRLSAGRGGTRPSKCGTGWSRSSPVPERSSASGPSLSAWRGLRWRPRSWRSFCGYSRASTAGSRHVVDDVVPAADGGSQRWTSRRGSSARASSRCCTAPSLSQPRQWRWPSSQYGGRWCSRCCPGAGLSHG